MNDEENKKSNNLFVIIMLLIVIVLVLFFPKIYNFIESSKLPEVQNNEEQKSDENIVTDEILSDIHFPIMRKSAYDINTYYSLEQFTIKDMSNSDILYNAFMGIEETNANIKQSSSYSRCSKTPMEFDSNKIDLRIKNILGRNVEYTLESFYVPEDSTSSYKGNWRYDSSNSKFIYDGICKSESSNVKYYDLKDFIKAEYEGNDIVVYYYVGFAKVDGKNYTIYSDANMTNQISSGENSDIDAINSIFTGLNNSNKRVYKYTFKNTLCSYSEYCLYKGEYVNEL